MSGRRDEKFIGGLSNDLPIEFVVDLADLAEFPSLNSSSFSAQHRN
jgi:hypothetical protein